MPGPAVSSDLFQLLRDVATSYESMYVLVALYQSRTGLTASELSTQLQLPPGEVTDVLRGLQHASWVSLDGGSRRFTCVATQDPSKNATLFELVEHLDAGGISIAKILNTAAVERLRLAARAYGRG